MTLTTKQWKEVKDGFGLEEVPKTLQKEFVCCMCMRPTNCKLYTDRPLPNATNLRKYQEQCEQIRQNCFCHYHAEEMFGPGIDFT